MSQSSGEKTCLPSYGTIQEDQEKLVKDEEKGHQRKCFPGIKPTGAGMVFKQCLAEFLSLVIFTFIAGITARGGSVMFSATAQGLTIALLIVATGHISGGHVNPVVTLSLLIHGTAPLLISILYWIAQFLGCFVGSVLIYVVLRPHEYAHISGGAIAVQIDGGGLAHFECVILEVILTFILVYTVLTTAVDRDDNALAPLAIGLAVFVDVLVGGDLSGAAMNPARAIGPLIMYTLVGHSACHFQGDNCISVAWLWGIHYIHWLGPILGAILAAVVYKYLLSTKDKKD